MDSSKSSNELASKKAGQKYINTKTVLCHNTKSEFLYSKSFWPCVFILELISMVKIFFEDTRAKMWGVNFCCIFFASRQFFV